MILSIKQKTKALNNLRGCAGWSAPVVLANPPKCTSQCAVAGIILGGYTCSERFAHFSAKNLIEIGLTGEKSHSKM